MTHDELRSGVIAGAARVRGGWRKDRRRLVEWMLAGGEFQDADDEDEE